MEDVSGFGAEVDLSVISVTMKFQVDVLNDLTEARREAVPLQH